VNLKLNEGNVKILRPWFRASEICFVSVQRDAAVSSPYFISLQDSLHVSGALCTHHQEYLKLQMQPLVQVVASFVSVHVALKVVPVWADNLLCPYMLP
jgi:hypothetical protein